MITFFKKKSLRLHELPNLSKPNLIPKASPNQKKNIPSRNELQKRSSISFQGLAQISLEELVLEDSFHTPLHIPSFPYFLPTT